MLQFANLQALKDDLNAKPAVYSVADTSEANTVVTGFRRYDLRFIKIVKDADGQTRYVPTSQQILEDMTDNSFGYAGNRNWDEQDASAQTFSDELVAHAKSFEGQPVAGSTVVKVVVNDVNEKFRSGTATAYLADGTVKSAILYKDDADAWQTNVLN